MPRVDYYTVLGVQAGASAAEIRMAYRNLAKVLHPDAGGTADRFHLLQEAYDTLKDPRRRAAYDRRRSAPARGAVGDAGRTHAAARSRPRGRSHTDPAVPDRASRLRDFGEDAEFVPPSPKLDPDTVCWWQAVNPTARVRYTPAGAPGRTPTFAVLAGSLAVLLLPVILPTGLSPLLLAVWLPLVAAAVAVVLRLLRRQVTARRVDQAFTVEFGGQRVFGRPGTEPAAGGERLTAGLLAEYLTRMPGARIFHGLALPGSVFADVDHAVLCGRRLVLLESKMWLPGHYEVDEAGLLWRNNHPFRGGATRLPEGIAAYRQLLPEVEVRGVVLIYPSRAGDVSVGDPPVDSAVTTPPMTPARFIDELGDWLADEPSTVDRKVFRKVLEHVVS